MRFRSSVFPSKYKRMDSRDLLHLAKKKKYSIVRDLLVVQENGRETE
jgi:hypothetical protein